MGITTSKPEEEETDPLAMVNVLMQRDRELAKLRHAFGNRCKINKQEYVDMFLKLYSSVFTKNNDPIDETANLGDSNKDDDMRKLAEHIFQAFDIDNKNYLCMNKFVVMYGLINSKDPKEKLLLLFKVYDKNKDGYLDTSEIEDFLPVVLRLYPEKTRENFDLTKEVKAIIKKLDKNKDDKISLHEFTYGLLKNPAIYELFSIDFKSIL